MAKTPKKVSSLYIQEQDRDYLRPEYLEATSGVVGVGQFYSEIENRAPIIDPSQDLGVRFGVNRIQTQQIYKLQGEVGLNGKPVFGVINDKFNQVRFVGEWRNNNDLNGPRPYLGSASDSDDYVEITFYGTGLNLLVFYNNFNRDIRVSIDGGAEGSNIMPTSGSPILESRGYSQNTIVNAVNGLTLGVHTAKVRCVSGEENIYGFEILNERTDLLISQGSYFNDGKLLRLESEQNVAYNSVFANEYGTAGPKGGCVVVYLTEEGAIKKDIRYTDVTALYLGAADHSNEEIISKHYYREFGSGRADDFSTITSATADRAYTLDDGTTTLIAEDVELNNPNPGIKTSPSDFITITFVGTGLDIVRNWRAASVNWQHSFEVDGNSVGTLSGTSGSDYDTLGIVKICSGLPYGTHTVRIIRDTDHFNIFDFVVYGPKKPEIEESAAELGSYYLMADYVANTTNGLFTVAQGVIRKQNNREWTYINGHAISIATSAHIGGWSVNSNTNTSVAKYTFFGTGFEFRGRADATYSSNVQCTLDGSTDFSSYTTSAYGGFGFTPGTGVLQPDAGSALGSGFTVSGLTLGWHTIEFANTQNNTFTINCIDIICPIHSPKLNGPFIIQNTLRIGSQSVGDSRGLPIDENKYTAFAKGITGNPSTTSNAIIPANEMNLPVVMDKDGEVEVELMLNWGTNVEGQEILFEMFVDGERQDFGPDGERWESRAVSNQWSLTKITKRLFLSKGQHQIDIGYCAGGAVTATLQTTKRQLTVTKL